MIQKLLGLLFLVGAGFLAWTALNENSTLLSPSKEAPKNLSFSDFVSADLSSLRSQGQLPKEWADIQHVSYLMHTAFQKELVGNQKFKAIPENPSGRYKLEIEFIDVPDDAEPGLILQMSMMDIQTNNKVWELGRTYPLRSFLVIESEDPAKTKPIPAPQPEPETTPAKDPQK